MTAANLSGNLGYSLPTEILLQIFSHLHSKDLFRYRRVSRRWKSIVDDIICSDTIWENLCDKEFQEFCWIAKRKAKPEMSWFSLYRSLSLWSKVADAQEEIIVFASASKMAEEVRSVEILAGDVVGVHKNCGIVYYNSITLQRCDKESIIGNYVKYSENEYALVIQNYHFHLFVIRKIRYNRNQDEFATFDDVKMYYLVKDEIYFVNTRDEVYHCAIYLGNKIKAQRIPYDADAIVSLGFTNGCLNILTYDRKIYSLLNGRRHWALEHIIINTSNIMDVLHKYRCMEDLDWRVYFQWMALYYHKVPDDMRDIIIVRSYGDIFFVGTCYGVLKIYFYPYINGKLDIFNSSPLKEIDFMDIKEIPEQSTCPILDIDMVETENGHTVFVAMPKMVAVLRFTHDISEPVWSLQQ